jgi:uncharacterized protein (TIGR03083 family)
MCAMMQKLRSSSGGVAAGAMRWAWAALGIGDTCSLGFAGSDWHHRPMPTPDPRAVRPATALLDRLADVQDAFAALLDTADPDAPVAACAPWTVTDLALHLGGVHRWAAAMARGVDRDDQDPVEPRDPVALRAFYREQAAALRGTLHAIGPDAPAITLDGPGPASFWHRRQVHETLVHLHDLADALDVPHPVDDPALWADTVDEVLTVMAPRQVRLGRIAAVERPVRIAATDAGRSWVLGGGDAASAEVAGDARTLALLLWGRTGADDPALTVTGPRADLDAALARALTP